jgi:hypothetical protein
MFVASLATPTLARIQKYQPSLGQNGKDVIWVPTPDALVEAMLDMAKLTPEDYLIDLGSGDGRIVIAAAKRGAKALGIEFNPDMVELSKENANTAGVSSKARFRRADIFQTNFRQADVLTLYLLPHLNLKLRPTILSLRPGTRIVSHAFDMDDWEPDQTAMVEERTAYLWIVPAEVEGTWMWNTGSGKAELEILQAYQKIEGILQIEGEQLPLRAANLDGSRIGFTVGESRTTMRVFAGRVTENTIEGLSKFGAAPPAKWSASRHASQ